MKHYRSARILLFALLLLSGLNARAASVSLDEYRRQLHELAASIDALQDPSEKVGAVLANIPEKVTVVTRTGEITINQRNLKNDLATLSTLHGDKRAALLSQIRNYCHQLEDGAAFSRNANSETSTVLMPEMLSWPDSSTGSIVF